jgi:TLD
LQALGDSAVLALVSDEVVREFCAKLTTVWLRGKRFDLLYRGSRDGMTPAAFHEKCDGKGPTLVLIAGQSVWQRVSVFGGYASESWERGPEDANEFPVVIDAGDSFVFTVVNPSGDGIVKMPVIADSPHAAYAMRCSAHTGPTFGVRTTIAVWSSGNSPTSEFDEKSHCTPEPGSTFGDPLGRRSASFTGGMHFTPKELEVWAVY